RVGLCDLVECVERRQLDRRLLEDRRTELTHHGRRDTQQRGIDTHTQQAGLSNVAVRRQERVEDVYLAEQCRIDGWPGLEFRHAVVQDSARVAREIRFQPECIEE